MLAQTHYGAANAGSFINLNSRIAISESKIREMLDFKKTDFPEWSKQRRVEFAFHGLLEWFDGSFIPATIEEMEGKTDARKAIKLRKEKTVEESKLTQCLALIENSCVPSGMASDLIRQGLLDRDLKGVLKTLKDYFSKPDIQSIQELLKNLSKIVPNQGPQSTINLRRESFNALLTMHPEMVIPPAIAVVMVTQATTGPVNDSIINDALGQIMRDQSADHDDVNFARLQSEIVKVMMIKNIHVGQGDGSGQLSSGAPSVMQLSSLPSRSVGNTREWMKNDCPHHPWIRGEGARHTLAECSRRESTEPYPSAVQPPPFKAKRTFKPPKSPVSQPTSPTKQTQSGGGSVMTISSADHVYDGSPSPKKSAFRVIDSNNNVSFHPLESHSPPTNHQSSGVFSPGGNYFEKPPEQVYFLNGKGHLELLKNASNSISNVNYNVHQQFSSSANINKNVKNKNFANVNLTMCSDESGEPLSCLSRQKISTENQNILLIKNKSTPTISNNKNYCAELILEQEIKLESSQSEFINRIKINNKSTPASIVKNKNYCVESNKIDSPELEIDPEVILESAHVEKLKLENLNKANSGNKNYLKQFMGGSVSINNNSGSSSNNLL